MKLLTKNGIKEIAITISIFLKTDPGKSKICIYHVLLVRHFNFQATILTCIF